MPQKPTRRTAAAGSIAADDPPDFIAASSCAAGQTLRGDGLAFLRGFLQRPRRVASIVPSSVFLERRVVRAAGLAQARCVVELGPGTGGTTCALLRAAPMQARLLAIDLDPDFRARPRRQIADPRLAVQPGGAEALDDHLRQWALPASDTAVSGIPFSTLPAYTARRIAGAIGPCPAPGGRFVAYPPSAHVAGYLAPHLGVPLTACRASRKVPPMRVFRWVKAAVSDAA